MAVNDAIKYSLAYQSEYNYSISKGDVKAPEFMTCKSYEEYANNPQRCSKNITDEEYAALIKIIEFGEKHSDPSVRNNAKTYRKNLEALRKSNYEIEYGVSEEEFKAGNHGSYEKRWNEVTNKEKELLKRLNELDNATFCEKISNLFTGKITDEREQLAKELVNIVEIKDKLNSKITYRTIEINQNQ